MNLVCRLQNNFIVGQIGSVFGTLSSISSAFDLYCVGIAFTFSLNGMSTVYIKNYKS